MSNDTLKHWLAAMPKAELHMHIDGSLQAQRMLSLAEKNKVRLPYSTVEEVEAAYNFVDLQSFLDLYYLGASVLKDEEDFYHLMMDYLLKCKEQKIRHCEIMVEPQTYFPAGVSFATVMRGFNQALSEAKEKWQQSSLLILSFLRHLSEDEALAVLDAAKVFGDDFVAVGLASAELGNPPSKFTRLYRQAQDLGLHTTVHAGEEGPAEFIWDSLNILQAQRIDHGVRCVDDRRLLEHLAATRIPLTVCPLSNIKLCVFDEMAQHNILRLLDMGLCVTVNSDDPAYFGGFLNENYAALVDGLQLDRQAAVQLARNSFEASFLSDAKKAAFVAELRDYADGN